MKDCLIQGTGISLQRSKEKDARWFEKAECSNKDYVQVYQANRHIECMRDPDCLHISILTRSNNQIAGHVLLFGLQSANKSIELRRIVVAEKEKGVGREALQLVKAYCFHELKAQRIWLDVVADNARAIHLYESIGFAKCDPMGPSVFENSKREVLYYQLIFI